MRLSTTCSVLAAAAALCAPLSAQGVHALAPFGVGVTVPDEHGQAAGAASTGNPLAGAPNRFQQVIDAGDLPEILVFDRLGFRKDDQLGTFAGHVVELEILIGYTTLDQNTLTNDFAANFDTGAPEVSLARQNVSLPSLAWPRPDLEEFEVQITLDEPFVVEQLGDNLLIEIVNYGNDQNGAAFSYPMDSGSGTDSAMVLGLGPAATTGLVLRGTGIALRLLTEPDRAAGYAPRFNPAASMGMPPTLMGIAPPLVGATAAIQIDALGYDLALLALSTGLSPNLAFPLGGFQLPVYTNPAGMLGTVSVPMFAGQGFLDIGIPPYPVLMGMDMVWQGFTLQSNNLAMVGATNALLANIGDSTAGIMNFAIQHTSRIDALSYLKDQANNPQNIHCAGASSADKIRVAGTKNATVGPLEIRVLNAQGTVVSTKTVGANSAQFSETVDVPAGHYVYLYNASATNSMNVTYEVDIVR